MIKVYNINPVNKGDLLATFSLEMPGWQSDFHEMKVFQKGLNRWIGMPSVSYEVNGERKYKEIWTLKSEAAKKRLRDQILEAVDQYIMQNGDLVPEDVYKLNQEMDF